MDIHQLAPQYFSNIRNRNLDGLCALYVADAVLAIPDGTELTGLSAIREMYSDLFANQAPSPTLINAVIGDCMVAAELQIQLPNGDLRYTANFFHLTSEGLIKRLSVYARR